MDFLYVVRDATVFFKNKDIFVRNGKEIVREYKSKKTSLMAARFLYCSLIMGRKQKIFARHRSIYMRKKYHLSINKIDVPKVNIFLSRAEKRGRQK